MTQNRYLQPAILDSLQERMAFLGGPRQVGKTTVAQAIGETNYKQPRYLNWDHREHRRQIIKGNIDSQADLVIFDEVHKYRPWKRLIKGIYDIHKNNLSILVTGSARLDVYRRGGDSLLGRYDYYRLHPFSVAELLGKKNLLQPRRELHFESESKASQEILAGLMTFGGFPEPFLRQNQKRLRLWQNQRLERLVREDIRDVESIRDLASLEILAELLPERVGSLLSLNSLREDLEVAHKTIALWVNALERFYYHFRIRPFHGKRIASLRKEPKLYLWDWSAIENEGARFENLVGSHLLKLVHYLQDTEGFKAELHFLRDSDGREVDFLVTVNRQPWFAVEVKLSEQEIARPLRYYGERLKIPFLFQVIQTPGVDFQNDGVRVLSAAKFLAGLA